jgi:hypothetical protein
MRRAAGGGEKSQVSWVVTPYWLINNYQNLRRTYFLHLHGRAVHCSTMKMKHASSKRRLLFTNWYYVRSYDIFLFPATPLWEFHLSHQSPVQKRRRSATFKPAHLAHHRTKGTAVRLHAFQISTSTLQEWSAPVQTVSLLYALYRCNRRLRWSSG